MSKTTFAATARLLGHAMERTFERQMTESGRMQHEIAIDGNDLHQGVSTITAVASLTST